ncbi:MAG TPA: MEDS domain-containing protein [Streptosporangiaceae bacterium]
MGSRAPDIADLDFQVGDHVCAFYNEGRSALDDIIVDYLSKGLQEGNKCACFSFADTASSARDRIPPELMSRDGILQFYTENQAKGGFSVEAGLRTLEEMAKEALSDGYGRLWALGDMTFVARGVSPRSMKMWFTYEAEINELASPRPQLIMCLYDLDQWAGELVMNVLKTHPRIFVNGLVLNNPYYVPLRQFLGSL